MVELTNIMESLVYDKLTYLLKKNGDCCMCDQCVSDMMCIILNKLPAKYVNTKAGEVLSKIKPLSTQEEIDMLNRIMESYNIVKSSPRH
ncbi:MAG: late competence development ComFB family protein [Clostridia bacterium]